MRYSYLISFIFGCAVSMMGWSITSWRFWVILFIYLAFGIANWYEGRKNNGTLHNSKV